MYITDDEERKTFGSTITMRQLNFVMPIKNQERKYVQIAEVLSNILQRISSHIIKIVGGVYT